ncbi:MAG: hypothetical protein R3F59_19795 [Myxococcota bacterium]
MVVPVGAVVDPVGGALSVFVVDGEGNAARVPVEAGALVGDEVVVRGGLSAGQAVVTAGQSRLLDGDRTRCCGERADRPALPRAPALAMVALLVAVGLGAWRTMPRQEDPSFVDRFGTVIVPWPGAEALRVEQLVVRPCRGRAGAGARGEGGPGHGARRRGRAPGAPARQRS